MKKVTLDIAGMRCGSCVIGIELILTRQKGIKSAKVSLNDRTAIVEYDPAIMALSDISKVVSDLGYIATVRS
jgi:copper chaperone CopZ